MPIHAPKIGFLGIWPPKWGAVWTRPPKGTFLRGNTSYDVEIVKIVQLVRARRELK